MPSSKGRLTAASTHWMLYSGAKNPLVFLKIDFLNLEKDEYLENCSRLENLID